jgi:type IV pilus assembly protein PilX
MRAFTHPPCRAGQRGVALLTALLLMLAVLLSSIAAARTAISGARAAGHERDRLLALQAAMAALADAEHDIEGGANPGSARAAALAQATPAVFAPGCGGGRPYDGLCEHAPDARAVFALLADDDGPAVPLGTFTGALLPVGEGALPSQAPRYLIERMPAASGALLYRVSALGFGSAATTQVALQAYYRKLPTGPAPQPEPGPVQAEESDPQAPAPAPPALPGTAGGPGIRVGWREIGNWHEAVAAGTEG